MVELDNTMPANLLQSVADSPIVSVDSELGGNLSSTDHRSSSAESSPFLTIPDIRPGSRERVISSRDLGYSSDKLEINSRDGLANGDNLSSMQLHDSLNRMNLKDEDEENGNYMDYKDSVVNSSINDMSQVFDEDLDLDSNVIHDKYGLNDSPWRNLRSASTQDSVLTKRKFEMNGKRGLSDIPSLPYSTVDIDGAQKIKDLEKQVTGFKIQIKFFRQFLQNIIDKSLNSDQNFVNINELATLQSNFKGFVKDNFENFHSEGSAEYKGLQESTYNEKEELMKLNDDLYTNLENFQSKLEQQELNLAQLKSTVSNVQILIDKIITDLIEGDQMEIQSKEKLSILLDHTNEVSDKPASLEEKLQAISEELKPLLFQHGKKLDHVTEQEKYKNFNMENFSFYLNALRDTVRDLNKFKIEYMTHKGEVTIISQGSANKPDVQSIRGGSNSQVSLEFSHNDSVDSGKSTNPQPVESLNSRPEIIGDINTQNEERSRLPEEIAANGDLKPMKNHKGISHEQDKIGHNSEKNSTLDNVYMENKIVSLTEQLYRKTKESIDLGAKLREKNNIENELQQALQTERVLKTDKTKLKYDVEILKSEKEAMQMTIRSLMEKVRHSSFTEDESDMKVLTQKLETYLNEIMSLHLRTSKSYLKSFIKIADDVSLKIPKKCIETLTKLRGYNKDSEDNEYSWNLSEINLILDSFKKVSDYFARAVEILVNDHVKLLLQNNDKDAEISDYIKQLNARQEELTLINDSLTRQLDAYEKAPKKNYNTQSYGASPRSEMRIEELTKRWKSEREARVFENKEAQKRIRELSMENSNLRNELDKYV